MRKSSKANSIQRADGLVGHSTRSTTIKMEYCNQYGDNESCDDNHDDVDVS